MRAVEDWKTEPLGRVARLTMGQSPDSRYYSEEENGLPFLQGCAEFKGRFPIHSLYCSQIKKIATVGSILFSVRAPVGRINIADRDYIIGRGLAGISGIEVDQAYLEHYLTFVEPNFRNASQGSTFEAINSSELNGWPIEHPVSKTEQAKIAEILSTVDRTIEQTEALIAKQQRIKTGLMQDLLTRGIDEHGNLRSEQTHKFKDSPLGRIPVEWEVEKWSQVCSKIQDGTHFSPLTDSSAEFKYVTSKNIKFGFFDLSDVEYIDKRQHDEIYKRCDVCLGDVLLTKDGANTGNVAINLLNEEFSLLSSVALIRPLESELTSMFLLQTILSESGQRLIKDAMSGLAITRVTLEIINNFLMKVPHIQEQKNIGQFLAVQDERIKSEAKKLAKLRSLKAALMQDLLTGKKRVTAMLEATEVATL